MTAVQAIDVVLWSCSQYLSDPIKEQLDRFAEILGVPRSLAGHRVLLKPNLISSRAPALACTNGVVLACLAEWFLDRGARVVVGDSPAFGSARQVMNRQGILAALTRLDVTVVEFRTARQVDLSHGVRIGIAEEALDCDLFVNVPKVKAHSQMFVTLAVKNLFGIVCGMRKAMAHMKNGPSHQRFADLMLDLQALLPTQLTFIDGIEAMHRQGPVKGEPLALGCLGASRSPVALDTTMLDVLELDRRLCPIAVAAERRNEPGCRRGDLHYPLLPPNHFHGSGFIAPATLSPVPFNPFRFLVSSFRRAFGRVAR